MIYRHDGVKSCIVQMLFVNSEIYMYALLTFNYKLHVLTVKQLRNLSLYEKMNYIAFCDNMRF